MWGRKSKKGGADHSPIDTKATASELPDRMAHPNALRFSLNENRDPNAVELVRVWSQGKRVRAYVNAYGKTKLDTKGEVSEWGYILADLAKAVVNKIVLDHKKHGSANSSTADLTHEQILDLIAVAFLDETVGDKFELTELSDQ